MSKYYAYIHLKAGVIAKRYNRLEDITTLYTSPYIVYVYPYEFEADSLESAVKKAKTLMRKEGMRV